MMKRAYRMSIMDGQVVAQKVMEEDQLLERGAQELDEYLELEGRYVGVFVLLHEDGVAQYLDSGTLYTLDGEYSLWSIRNLWSPGRCILSGMMSWMKCMKMTQKEGKQFRWFYCKSLFSLLSESVKFLKSGRVPCLPGTSLDCGYEGHGEKGAVWLPF